MSAGLHSGNALALLAARLYLNRCKPSPFEFRASETADERLA
jgi:hypothetical protein